MYKRQALSTVCAAAPPTVDLSAYGREVAGPRTQVMVLGSTHLSAMPDDFRAERLDPLLARLEAYAPTIITIESVSGEDCDPVSYTHLDVYKRQHRRTRSLPQPCPHD